MKDTYVLKDKLKEPIIVRILFYIAVTLCGIGGLYLIADALVLIFAAVAGSGCNQILTGVPLLFIGLLLFRIYLKTLILHTRTCIINKNGFTIISCKWFRKDYCWSDISSIVLCDANYYSSHYGDMYKFVIRIAIGDEAFGPLNNEKAYPIFTLTHAESWRTLVYARKHLNNVFLFEFTPERYNAISQISGLEIPKCISKQAWEKFAAEHDFSI